MKLNYHTYREIHQQPVVWKKAYDIIRARKAEIAAFLDANAGPDTQIVLTGAGTSAYIGDALAPALFRCARTVCAIATTDIITHAASYFDSESKVLLVSFARSGNSPESVGAVKAVEKTAGKVSHIFITCNEKGELARMEGDNILTVLLPPETNDQSLAMTSSYSTMLLVCSLILQIRHIEEEEKYIDALAAGVQQALDKYEESIKALADIDFHRAVFLGSGPLKGVAEESRLKLQELTDGGVMCAFDSFLGFRHGPKAVVNADSIIVYLISPDPQVKPYERDLIQQIEKQHYAKAYVGIGQREEDLSGYHFDVAVNLGLPEGMPDYYSCVAYVVVAQLLGLFKSIQCGLSPDAPSVSGNISRVVEGVTLYL